MVSRHGGRGAGRRRTGAEAGASVRAWGEERWGRGGCAVSAAGALTAVSLGVSPDRARIHLGDGVERQGMELGVLFTELPPVFLAGAALPLLAHAAIAGLLHNRQERRDRHRGAAPARLVRR
ncbi:hypothetical protein [Streptomyces sp. NPDC048481]|uniref:hypothetical protein n=1 Tax=Streptomyces sp. NPDC048481 TaxID=3365557 RepID=UPI00371840E0